ncbi:hypothetical protein QTP86_002532 [Hemibagrus guttatus]|nr:hypothetical protein QTP86_002532 [Hemibagrus guttatus]
MFKVIKSEIVKGSQIKRNYNRNASTYQFFVFFLKLQVLKPLQLASYHANYPLGSALRAEKARELKAALGKQQSFFTRPAKKSQKATEASFRDTHFLIKKKKAFSDGEVVKEAMMIIANTVLKDEKNGTDLISTLSDVQLGASTMARRVSAMSGNLADQLDRDLAKCRWFSIQCDGSVDSSSTAQLLVFIRMVFEDFSTREELLTLLPLMTTTRGVDIYNTVKEFFVQKKVPLEKLVAVTTDGAPAMIGRQTGFIAHCKADPDFPKFLHYHCIIHQQTLCAKVIGFGHVMTPVVKIINNIRSKAKQHRIFKVLLEEMSAEYGDLLLHTEIRWLSRGRVLHRFLSLLGEIKEFMQSKGEDVSLLEDTEWTLDLAFLTDITGKLNHLNCELQGKGKTVVDMISALNAFKAKMNIFSVGLQRKKVLHFPSVQSVLKDNASTSETFDKVAEKHCLCLALWFCLLSRLDFRLRPLRLPDYVSLSLPLPYSIQDFQVGLFHREHLAFYVTSSPANPVILGFPWLRQHDPQISWHKGALVRWSATCLSKCLHEPVSRPCLTSVVEDSAPLASGHVPRIYGDFQEVFSKERAARLPSHRAWDCTIDLLCNTSTPSGRAYPLSLPEARAMEEYIEEALAVGHIRPSTSPAAAGFFFVGKKDGGLHPCIDYRGLNTITVRYPYPLPLVPAALEQLRGAKFFTKLDLLATNKTFTPETRVQDLVLTNLVRIREGDEWKIAFHTTHGHYEYLVMPFGLTNAPAVFQSLINKVFQDILGKWVIAYIDDILVYSTSLEEHVRHVRAVLSRLQQNHLYVKPEKCEFHWTTITFLGYVISRQGVEMDLTKVQAVTEWPNPTTVKELQRFLGFANFYRCFI